jgi:spermidine synthase
MNVYLGLFLIAFAGLTLELALVRLLSVTTWYHLAFFAISTAMLGMTAGATKVYLRPDEYTPDKLSQALSRSCILFALAIPATLIALCLVPMNLDKDAMSPISILITTIACALPFYFSGIVITATLTKSNLPVGRLYASDLVGASLGCLFVLGGLELMDAPSLILLCSSTATLSAICFAWGEGAARKTRCLASVLCLFFLAASFANSLTTRGLQPMIVKGKKIEISHQYELVRWNSFSRIAVYRKEHRPPYYWGASALAPQNAVEFHYLNIDGEAGTPMNKFTSLADIEFLRYDVTNFAYHLGRKGSACVIGVGGGRDLQSALLFGHNQVTGVEINPIIVNLLRGEFKDFTGLANRSDVTIVSAEARNYLSQHPDKYSLIQMSLIDTWAATGAGAFSLSENTLYTVEAWRLFLDRLQPDGIFTVSRWHSPGDIGETGRVISLAIAALIDHQVPEPGKHLALITAGNISTLLVSRQPFSREDIDKIKETSEKLRFELVLHPEQPPADRLLRDIVSARTDEQLSRAVSTSELNYDPPTDEDPYFFNMLRLRHIHLAFSKSGGVIRGNLIATMTLGILLITLLLVAVATIILPLKFRKSIGVEHLVPSRTLWSGVVYFSLIGAGFMLTEIALIQRLTVILSHPMHALGILLFTLIASTGIGSLVSDRLPLTRPPWLYVYPLLTVVCLLSLRFILSSLLQTMVYAPTRTRIVTSVALIFPMGLLMGLFFPTGMRLAKAVSNVETPWYWALNGIFGVLCSAIAVLISIYVGVSANFYIAAICYGLLVIPLAGLRRALPKA